MAKILVQLEEKFPFDWVNLSSFRDSNAFRKEVYLLHVENMVDDLIDLFHYLFGSRCDKILVYNESWWDYCLDTWHVLTEEYNYDTEGKNKDCAAYLRLLEDNNIGVDFSGCCLCNAWRQFLKIILDCVVTHQAPYSPLFCDRENSYFFYFHATGSIGIYYTEENDVVREILANAIKKYEVVD